MKKFWLLSVFAFAALAGTAVWFGGLNQDEGWYLYASRMVAEGMPLRVRKVLEKPPPRK